MPCRSRPCVSAGRRPAGDQPEPRESSFSPRPPATVTTRSRLDLRQFGLATDGGFAVDATEDAAAFSPENLNRYAAVVFLNSSGEVFDEKQKAAFQGFIRGGGGLAAVHQGVTTLDKWPWYVALVGGVKFAGHPNPAGDLPLRDPRPSRDERAARLMQLGSRNGTTSSPIPAPGPTS